MYGKQNILQKYGIVVLYESCPASWSFMKISSVTSHFPLHNAKNDFLTHTSHASSPMSAKFDNRKCSHSFLEHFWISWKSVREKSCFTCRRKLNFAPLYYIIQQTWWNSTRDRATNVHWVFVSFVKICTVKSMTYLNMSIRFFTTTLRSGRTSVQEICIWCRKVSRNFRKNKCSEGAATATELEEIAFTRVPWDRLEKVCGNCTTLIA